MKRTSCQELLKAADGIFVPGGFGDRGELFISSIPKQTNGVTT